MSEKTKTPKVIYIALHNMQNLEDEGLQGGFSTIKKHITGGATAYILKSKYDELSLENARLGADLAKVEAELKECKEGFTKQIDEFYELRKVTIDTINQRNELLIENTKLKAELEKVKGENRKLNSEMDESDELCEPEFCEYCDMDGHLGNGFHLIGCPNGMMS